MDMQQLVEELAVDLGRAVVINDTDFVPIAASVQGAEVDAPRIQALLQRKTPKPIANYLLTLRLDAALSPVIVHMQIFGGLERLCIPIRDENGPVGYLWLITQNHPKLTAGDFRLIDATVSLARTIITGTQAATLDTTATATMERLLGSSADIRIASFTDAITRRLLERSDRTIVVAVSLVGSSSDLHVEALGTHISRRTGGSLYFIGQRGKTLFFAGIERGTLEDFYVLIRDHASKHAIRLTGIGSARYDGLADDLESTARKAERAAEFSALLPEFRAGVQFEELGGWHLVGQASSNLVTVKSISPAAAHLIWQAEPIHRETIEAYLDAGGVARLACEHLNIHRTTFYYRLDNMHDVVKEALADGWQRTSLHMALNLARLTEGKPTAINQRPGANKPLESRR